MGNIKRVFVASPNDVVAEREIVTKVIDEVNAVLPRDFDCRYEVIKWETHVDSRIGNRPQAVIDNQVGIKNIDIFIGILWSRFGTPTGGMGENGRRYLSGTEEEFDIAYESWKENGSPELMFFRKTKNPHYNTDPKQFQKVKRFFDKFKVNEVYQGLYSEFNTRAKFEKLVRSAILRDAFKDLWGYRPIYIDFLDELVKDGVQKIYTANNNFVRNEEKKESMNNTKELKLIAHSGYSFIAPRSRIFRGAIEKKLKEDDFKFDIILNNPWSDSGFYFALGGQNREFLQDSYEYNSYGAKSFVNSIDVLDKTSWYRQNFKNSIDGYEQLKEKYGDRIQLRLVRCEMPASILITDNDCFFESYLPINQLQRTKNGMITFEMKVSNESSLYQHSNDYFDFIWSISDDYSVFAENEKFYKKMLRGKERFLKKG